MNRLVREPGAMTEVTAARGSRGNGEGSITYDRSRDRYVARVTNPDGTRSKRTAKTRQEAAKLLTDMLGRSQNGHSVPSHAVTVGAYLTQWLDSQRPNLSAPTHAAYTQRLTRYVIPGIGGVRLERLQPDRLATLYASLLAPKPQGAGLSGTTVQAVHEALYRALQQALRWGMVTRNVAALVDKPKRAKVDIKPLSFAQAKQLLEAAKGDRLEAVYVLALATGMREGELLALRWDGIDLDGGTLSVTGTLRPDGTIGTPKTKGSKRLIHLDPASVDALRAHRSRQAAERLAASEYVNTGLVFTRPNGEALRTVTDLLRGSFDHVLRRAGLPHIRFHDLRHTFATLMLGANEHPKVVSEMLGHGSIRITLDTYSHAIPAMHRDAAHRMGALLFA
jgi:integrase